MRPLWPYAVLAALSAIAAFAFSLGAALVAVGVCCVFALARNAVRAPRTVWALAAVVSGAAALTALAVYIDASSSCVADYDSHRVVIGTRLQAYVHPEPGASAASLLFDAAGKPEAVWTPESIRACCWRLGWIGSSALPFFALCGCCLLQLVQVRLSLLMRRQAAPAPAGDCRFDAFFSYRHCEPDRSLVVDLLSRLEEQGVRTAIDERDFRPNEQFLPEMERCIRESRYVLCVITSRYLESDHCLEEAVLSKTLDMGERRKRIVPLIFEPVQLPVWLHGIVGIDFTGRGATDGFEKLRALLRSE